MVIIKESVLSLKKNKKTMNFLLSNCSLVLKAFMTNLLNIIFWRF